LLLGVPVMRGSTWEQMTAVAVQLPHTNLTSLLLGVGAILVLLLARRHTGMLARLAPLVLIAMATLLVVILDLDRKHGVAVVGQVASGLPSMPLALPALADVGALLLPALVLAFIGTVQNITMAQALAMKRRERVDANQELVGLGLSNVVASFFGGMPVGGGMSRSAVNAAAGAQTPLASIVSAALMLAIVGVGTAAFARIPLPVLAASIVVAALGMMDVAEFRRAWAYDRADALAFLGTTVGVLALGLQWGIVLGIGLSLATLLYRASTPHIAVVGRIVGTEHFRNVERHGVETLAAAVFLRIDESLFFGNLGAIEARLLSELDLAPQSRAVVLIMSAVNRVDLTALEALTALELDLQERGVVLHLAEIKGPVQDRMLHTTFWSRLEGRIHLSANAAFEALKTA
jgi:SulP family sulfate permease